MAKRRKTNRPKADNHQAVTDRIIESLEKGVAPWACPWDRSLGLPRNGFSGRPYSGMNILLTWAAGFGDPRWYTFDNAQKLNGWEAKYEQKGRRKVKTWEWTGDGDAPCKPWECGVRKGEKSTKIVHYEMVTKTEKDETTGKDKVVARFPRIKVWSVFNHEQIAWVEGREPRLVENDIDVDTACEAASELFGALPAKVKHGGADAYYSPDSDRIQLPQPKAFKSADDYWATRAHETAHWTGHKLRCDRKIRNRFGSDEYAFEELVAELAAAFMAADLGLTAKLQHAEYIGHWVKVLKGDKGAIFKAAKLANEAVAWIVGDDKCNAKAA